MRSELSRERVVEGCAESQTQPPPDPAASRPPVDQAAPLLGENVAQAQERLAEVPLGMRRWLWFLLNHLCRGGLLTLGTSSQGVTRVACSPDGRRLAGDEDGGVAVWNAQTGAVLLTFRPHDKAVSWIGFSPDGSLANTHFSRGLSP